MTWHSFRTRRREEFALLRYWDDTVRRRPATPVPSREVDEDLASLVRALHPATAPAPERPAYADDLLQQLLATYKETTPMNATASTAPPALPDFLPQPNTRPQHRQPRPRERIRGHFAPALEIALIIALILASLGVLWISTNDTRQAIAPTAATPTAESTVVHPPDVPMYRGNPERTGVFPGPGIDGQPVELWRLSFAGPINSAPAIVDGVLYIGIGDGGVHAIDAVTGTTIWTFTGASSISSSPAVVDGLVYVGSDDGTLYALNAADGSEVWTASGTRSMASVAIVDGVVYTSGNDGSLNALDALSGEEIWQAPLGDAASRSPAASEGVVYMGSADGVLHTFDAATGEPGWAVQLDGDGVISTTVVTGGVVYEGTFEGDENHFFALDAATGEELWRFTSPSGGGFLSAATDGETVYTVSEDTHVYAFDAATGEVRWQFETGDKVIAVPGLVGDILYVAGYDEIFYALDAATGTEIWQYPIEGPGDYGPVVSGGIAYIGTGFGYLYAIGGSDDTTAPPAGIASPVPATPVEEPVAQASPEIASQLATFLWETASSDESDEMGLPGPVTVAPDGTIWWTDAEYSRFHLFAPDGTFIETWGAPGSGDGEFNFAMSSGVGDAFGAVAFAPDGSFYVVDSGNRRVQHFSADREFLHAWGEFGPDDGQFLRPIDIAVDSQGNVYVVEETRAVIQKFNVDGDHLVTFGGLDQFEFIGNVGIDTNDNVWVADLGQVQQFDADGQFLAAYDGDGTLIEPWDVAVDAMGNIYVADLVAGSVVVLDPSGAVTGTWGQDETGPGTLQFPAYLTLNGERRVLVVDYVSDVTWEGRLVAFQVDPSHVGGEAATPTP